MAAQDTSALFSLSELMRLEQDRIVEEEKERRARGLAEENARRDAERVMREQERARLHLIESRRNEEALREREHAARLEGVRQAEVHRVRVETEHRGRLEALSIQQQHEQKLKALETDARKKRLSRTLGVLIAFSAALIVGGFSLYFGRLRPETRRQVQSLESLMDGQRLDTEKTKRALALQNQKILELEDRVRKEQESVAPVQPANEIKKNSPAVPVAPKRRGGIPGGDCVCADPHDPLCGCLKR